MANCACAPAARVDAAKLTDVATAELCGEAWFWLPAPESAGSLERVSVTAPNGLDAELHQDGELMRLDSGRAVGGERVVLSRLSDTERSWLHLRGVGEVRIEYLVQPGAPLDLESVDLSVALERETVDSGEIKIEVVTPAQLRVETFRLRDGLVLHAEYTDSLGRVALLGPAGDLGYAVRVAAEARTPLGPARVGPGLDDTWVQRLDVEDGVLWLGAELPTAAAAVIALAMADLLGRAEPWLPRATIAAPSGLVARWSPGRATPCGTCYVAGPPARLEVSGRASDPDQWDDAVIRHETAHHLLERYGADDSAGGRHNGMPVEPTLAWSEGVATFLASWGVGAVQYDVRLDGLVELDVERLAEDRSPPAGWTLAGDLSDHLVAGALWDLHDGGPDDDDSISLEDEILIPLIFAAGKQADVGASGADLADFIAADCRVLGLSVATIWRSRGFPFEEICD